MTEIQYKVLTLRDQGFTYEEIAQKVGRKSKGTIWKICKIAMKARAAGDTEITLNRVSHTCPHSPSCFTCPLDDCRVGAGDPNINALPFDLAYYCGRE